MHYHYMSPNSTEESYNGAKMVHSTMTEMISNVSSRRHNAYTACTSDGTVSVIECTYRAHGARERVVASWTYFCRSYLN